MTLIVDNREPQRILTLLDKQGIKYEKKKMPAGDYKISNLLIERKTFSDLVQSVIDGRFTRQLDKLSATGDKVIFIIEGSHPAQAWKVLKYSRPSADPEEMVKNIIITLACVYEVSIIYSKDHEETVDILNEIRLKKQYYRIHSPKKPKGLRPTEKVLTLIDGIGSTTARRITKQLGYNLSKYTKTNLLAINKIGVKTADRIMKFLKAIV